jgi:hypothetical protein
MLTLRAIYRRVEWIMLGYPAAAKALLPNIGARKGDRNLVGKNHSPGWWIL